jgi:hypothetical protein
MPQPFNQRHFHIPSVGLVALLLAIIAGAVYYLYATRPCSVPIRYKVGTIDPRFGISQTAFIAGAQQAADLWNTAEGHTVLQYDSAGTLPVSLLYDERQQALLTGQTIAEQEAALTTEKAAIDALPTTYDQKQQQLTHDKAAGMDVATLNQEVAAINALATQINSESESLSAKISEVNAQAVVYNRQAGQDFNEGVYHEQYGQQTISIYEFKDNAQLVRVLAHEFGHALGLGHNTNPDSIMYPVNSATNIALTPEDQGALQAACTYSLANFKLLLPAGW